MILRIALVGMMVLGLLGFGTVAWVSTHPPAPHAAAAVVPPPPPPPPPPAKVKLLVAAHALRAGSLIKPEDLGVQEILQAQEPRGASPETPAARASLFGAMVRRSLAAGEPVIEGDVMRPGDHGFLAAVLGPNMRAMTVGVDLISGSAGLIWPGDHVDVILTQAIDAKLEPGRRVAAETVLADVRVIAIDQHLVRGATADGPDPKAARTVSLEVTPAQAERLAVAGRIGQLSLIVRSAEQAAEKPDQPAPAGAAVNSTGVTWAADVSPALGQGIREPHPDSSTVRVFQGNADGKEFHF